METKEMSYNELVINGFMALFFNQGSCPKIKKFRNTSAGNITKLKNKAINPLITSSL